MQGRLSRYVVIFVARWGLKRDRYMMVYNDQNSRHDISSEKKRALSWIWGILPPCMHKMSGLHTSMQLIIWSHATNQAIPNELINKWTPFIGLDCSSELSCKYGKSSYDTSKPGVNRVPRSHFPTWMG